MGGGTRSAELTLPGFVHDVCSAVHPIGILSPFFRTLPLAGARARWLHPRASVAHPMDDGTAVMLYRSLERTAEGLGEDGARWARLVRPVPRRPARAARRRHGAAAASRASAADVALRAARRVPGEQARAALLSRRAGARAVRGLRGALDPAALAAVHGGARAWCSRSPAHVEDWPVAQGGSRAIAPRARVLPAQPRRRDRDRAPRRALADLPAARVVLFDTSPDQLARIAGDALPAGYRRRLARYRYGPGVFKLDWALDGPIPWRDPRCREASTVHVGGTLEEICASERDMYRGRHSERPVPDRLPAERVRPDARARGPAHGLRLLPRAARLDAST